MLVKRFIKTAGAVTAVILSAVVLTGCGGGGDPESDFEIAVETLEGGKQVVAISGYKGSKIEVRIPARIQGLPVAVIGEEAFEKRNIISVTIPNSVTEIGMEAFAGNQLTSVTIPNSVTQIGRWAFAGNTSLKSVTVPQGANIEEGAFPDGTTVNRQ